MAAARTPLGELTSFQTRITGVDLRREKERPEEEKKEIKERKGKTHPHTKIPGFGLHCPY